MTLNISHPCEQKAAIFWINSANIKFERLDLNHFISNLHSSVSNLVIFILKISLEKQFQTKIAPGDMPDQVIQEPEYIHGNKAIFFKNE